MPQSAKEADEKISNGAEQKSYAVDDAPDNRIAFSLFVFENHMTVFDAHACAVMCVAVIVVRNVVIAADDFFFLRCFAGLWNQKAFGLACYFRKGVV